MRHLVFAVFAALCLVLPSAASEASGSTSTASHQEITVMTRNLYFGADLTPVLAAQSQSQLLAAVATAYGQAQATDFAGRADSWAAEIAAARPDLVGLQEAVQWRTQFPADFAPIPDATTDAGDFVQLLLAALAKRGMQYQVASEATGYDVEAPGLFPAGLMDVRLTQHDVILARKGVGLTLGNAQSGNYVAAETVPLLGMPLPLPWSWASVDVTKGQTTFRFATTHLAPDDGAVQEAQAHEFINGPGATSLPLIWVGDFNSDASAPTITGIPPDTATYSDVRAAGFTDAWAATRLIPGYTCCNAPDLLNPQPTLDQRIDYVFSRGAVRPLLAERVGILPAGKTASGLWPSDHAGVVAELDVGQGG